MKSPSDQCALLPLAFPVTQFLYDVLAPPLIPGIATLIAPAFEPTQGCASIGGPTAPLVHWLRLAEEGGPPWPPAADAVEAPNHKKLVTLAKIIEIAKTTLETRLQKCCSDGC